MPRSASSMPCLLLTVVCTRAAAVQEASCATSCGFSWRLLLSWACVGIIPHGLVQQGAPEPLFDGSEMVVRSALRDGALTVGKSMLRHSSSERRLRRLWRRLRPQGYRDVSTFGGRGRERSGPALGVRCVLE